MSGSTLSSYKAAAATQMGPLIDLRSDGERQHDWQSDKDLRRELSNACHVISRRHLRFSFSSRRVNNGTDFIALPPELW